MNFFEHQHRARRKTWLLVVYFVLAVSLIIVAINAVIYFAFALQTSPTPSVEDWLAKPYWWWIAAATVFVIGLGTLNTMYKLRGGGRAVAEMVGARRLISATEDQNERRLINIVEEMSIASGTPVPELYVLDDEAGINAFVAGMRPTEAVLVVTRGALENLNRDELQGVIGHEYSHVLNGDMRINIRLMGIVAGILLIGQIGRALLRSSSRSRGRGKGSGQAVLLGLALFIIGYIGMFFGTLIKAAVSRQRELLADASSVQFTRNPSGIAGALWKIGQHAGGSLLDNAHSDDLNHFCFGDAVTFKLSSLMATHPPLDQRIKAIDPGFIAQRRADRAMQRTRQEARTAGAAPVPAAAAGFAGGAGMAIASTPEQVVQSIGTVTPDHLGHAEALHAALPEALLATLHQGEGARNVIYALLLAATDASRRQAGIDAIRRIDGEQAASAAASVVSMTSTVGAQQRLPVVNLAMPALRSLNREDRARLLSTAEALVRADQRLTIFEFALIAVLREHLADDAAADVKPKYFKYDPLMNEIRLLLSVLARVGASEESAIAATYTRVMAQFMRQPGEPAGRKDCTLTALNNAMLKLNLLAPMLKKSVIEACADCVIHDGKVLPGEAELLQAVAITLDCPMPPLLPAK
ncbi:MAG: M48 family metallopeptidase [Gammaproteobacteria bacterium]|nr:M48 family metallopeptidase [Gammaproteobacteria bacterium]